MSERESFGEIADRVKREREGKEAERKARAAMPPAAPARFRIPAPLRLPAGWKRRQPPPAPGKASREDLPLPLDTGIISLRSGAYQHKVYLWWWCPDRCLWIGICKACRERFRADLETAARLERATERYATSTSSVLEKSYIAEDAVRKRLPLDAPPASR